MNAFKELYIFVNFTNNGRYKEIALNFSEKYNLDLCDIYSYPYSKEKKIDLRELPYYISNISIPIIFYVEDLNNLQIDKNWVGLYKRKDDLILDKEGKFYYLNNM